MEDVREIYKNKVLQGLYGEFQAERDLAMAEMTRNLEYPETSNIDSLRSSLKKLAELSVLCQQTEFMFAPAAQAGLETEPCKKSCEKDESTEDLPV